MPWSPKTTPWDFGQDLLPPDLDRIAPSLEVGFRHFPALQHTGIRKIVNGAVHVLARRQSAGRPGARLEEFLVRLRRHGRLQPGRRRRAGALQLDGGRRSRLRHLGRWTSRASAPWATLGYTNAKVRENLFAPLPHPLPERGASRRAADADHRRSTTG